MLDFDRLFKRLDRLLDRVETMVPARTETRTEPGFSACRRHGYALEGIANFDSVDKAGLLHLERQQTLVFRKYRTIPWRQDGQQCTTPGRRCYR
jgi:hypothetical protein